MVNVLGQHVELLLARLAMQDDAAAAAGVAPKVHLYGKSDAVFKRKMGHVNVLAPNVEAALQWIEETTIWKV
ncbi:phosphoribosylaminoimidazole carboxylase ATPase subunit [compost metagenome]